MPIVDTEYMPYPTPTSPTLNDLLYNALDPAGALRTVSVVLPLSINLSSPVAQSVNTSENVVLNLPGFSYNVDTSDFLGTAENVVITPDPNQSNQFSIKVSDTTVTAESATETAPFLPASTLNVVRSGPQGDTVVTADPAVVVEA